MLAALLLGVMVTPAIAGLNLDSLINKAVKKLPVKPGTGQSVSMSDPFQILLLPPARAPPPPFRRFGYRFPATAVRTVPKHR